MDSLFFPRRGGNERLRLTAVNAAMNLGNKNAAYFLTWINLDLYILIYIHSYILFEPYVILTYA